MGKKGKQEKQTNKQTKTYVVIDRAVITTVVLSSNVRSEISPWCWSLRYSRNSLLFRTSPFISGFTRRHLWTFPDVSWNCSKQVHTTFVTRYISIICSGTNERILHPDVPFARGFPTQQSLQMHAVICNCILFTLLMNFGIPQTRTLSHDLPIPVAAPPEMWVCGNSLAGTAGSNPAGVMQVCLLWVLCAVRWMSLRLADHLSRGVLPSAVCLSVIVKPW